MLSTARLDPSTAPLEPSTAPLEPSIAPLDQCVASLEPSAAPLEPSTFHLQLLLEPSGLLEPYSSYKAPLYPSALYSSYRSLYNPCRAICRFSRVLCSYSRTRYNYSSSLYISGPIPIFYDLISISVKSKDLTEKSSSVQLFHSSKYIL